MPENSDNQPAFDPKIQSEDIAYKQSEMISCERCGRANPPNRSNCIYCARELDVATLDRTSMRFETRKLELWERGFNVILTGQTGAAQNFAAAADLLGIDAADLKEIASSEASLPIARVESLQEATVVSDKLEVCGFACLIVADDDLATNKPNIRVSEIGFSDEKLSLINFNTNDTTDFAWNDLTVIVSGILIKDRVDSLEKKGRRGKTKLIDETATSSDERIVDLYFRDHEIGYRVQPTGFDFSCLGEDKGLLVSENMRLLIAELRQRAPGSKLVNIYPHIRHLINDVWEIETRKDFHGLQRSGFGKTEFAHATSMNNLVQFNKFSRLQRHLR